MSWGGGAVNSSGVGGKGGCTPRETHHDTADRFKAACDSECDTPDALGFQSIVGIQYSTAPGVPTTKNTEYFSSILDIKSLGILSASKY